MSKKSRNLMKAICFVIIGGVVVAIMVWTIVQMWLSNTFLPTIGKFAIWNHIVRYTVYAILLIVATAACCMAFNGIVYLANRICNCFKRRY